MGPESNDGIVDAALELASAPTVTETLERAVKVCEGVVSHCDMAGISVTHGGRVRTRAASTQELRTIDDLQFLIHEGPCYDVLSVDGPVTANDLATDERWPRWGKLVSARTGAHASMSYRLFTEQDQLGALNMYSTRPAAFGHQDLRDGYLVAAYAAAAVGSRMKEAQLTTALESRTLIGQATGILMERFDLSAEAAFGLLRRISQTKNIKVVTLAQGLVEHGWLPVEKPDLPDGRQ